MTYLRHEIPEETAQTLTSLAAAVQESASYEMEDARRRFLLALRAMTVRKEKEESVRQVVEEWKQTLETAIRELRRRKRWKMRKRLLILAGVALFALLFHRNIGWWWLWLVLGGGAVELSDAPRETANALARTRDPRAVGVLAMAYRDGDSATREIAARGLIGILPALQASDRELIDAEGMNALLDILRNTKDINPDLIVALLRGMEQVGDARAIPVVEKWISLPVSLKAVVGVLARFVPGAGIHANVARIQQAARECLPYLEARAEQDRLRDTLLRPAMPPDDPASILLRPAGPGPSTPPEQLLRPVIPDN